MDTDIYWRAKAGRKDLAGADLRDADLRDVKLRDADLTGADLHGANLNRADMRRTDLHNADLAESSMHDAILYRANLHDADLHDADLHKADLQVADLQDADLHGADLSGAVLLGTKLIGANLRGAKVTEKQMSSGLFVGYHFDNGRLVADGEDQIVEEAPAVEETPDSVVDILPEKGPDAGEVLNAGIKQRIEDHAASLALVARPLASYAELAAAQIAAERPNSNEQIALKAAKLALLRAIADAASNIADSLDGLAAPSPTADELKLVVSNIEYLTMLVADWFANNAGEARQWAQASPAVGGIIGFSDLAGMPIKNGAAGSVEKIAC